MVKEVSFKDICVLAMAALLFSGEKRFVQFGGGHHEEHFCEII